VPSGTADGKCATICDGVALNTVSGASSSCTVGAGFPKFTPRMVSVSLTRFVVALKITTCLSGCA
jgi:hypothetical protein